MSGQTGFVYVRAKGPFCMPWQKGLEIGKQCSY